MHFAHYVGSNIAIL